MQQSLILKASAGTGKTYRLSLEYVKLLLTGVSYEDILVTTFTKKATLEIKERIMTHLYNLSKGNKFTIKGLINIGYRGRVDYDKANELYKELLSKKDRLKILTIDSFINSIFNKFVVPYFNLYGYSRVDNLQNEEHFADVLESIVQKEPNFIELNKFFNTFLEKDVTKYIGWIKDFINNRWKFLCVDRRNRPSKVSWDIEKSFNEVINNLNDFIKLKKSEDHFMSYIKDDFREILSSKITKETLEKKFYIFLGYKGDKGFWNGVKIRKSVSNVVHFDKLISSYDKFKKDLAAHIFNKKLIPLEKDIFKISDIIYKEYDKIKFTNKKLTYEDILVYTHQFIYKEHKHENLTVVDSNISHILIDEFQDTSILQWLILKPIIENVKCFTAVGDEKQAIYSWRGGEKELFKNLESILISKVENLNTCYRSRSNVINFTNNLFANLGILSKPVNCLPNKNEGYVEVVMEERREIKSLIADKIASGSIVLDKTAILARTNNELEEIAVYLKSANIPYVKESSLSILDHASIKPIVAFLQYILSNNIFELITFLRSDLINISSADMKIILQNRSKVLLFLEGEEDKCPKISKVANKILIVIKEVRKVKYSSLIKSIIEEMGVMSILSVSDIKNVNLFYELSKAHSNLVSFIDYLENNRNSEELKQIGVKNINAIKLMTIHKSKGLEFDTVILAWNFSSKLGVGYRSKLSFHLEFNESFEKANSYCFTSSDMSKILKYCGKNYQAIDKKNESEEELNGLYVGATRAKYNLIFFASFDKTLRSLTMLKEDTIRNGADAYLYKIKKALLNSVGMSDINELYLKGYSVGTMFNKKTNSQNDNYKPQNLSYLRKEITLKDSVEVKESVILENKIKAVKTIKKGIIAHYYLSNIEKNKFIDLDIAKKRSINKFQNMIDNKSLLESLESLEQFVKKSEIFEIGNKRILNELSIFEDGKEYRIDRLMIDSEKKVMEIIDYKTGREKEDKQLDKYKEILQKKYSNYKIETKFIKIDI